MDVMQSLAAECTMKPGSVPRKPPQTLQIYNEIACRNDFLCLHRQLYRTGVYETSKKINYEWSLKLKQTSNNFKEVEFELSAE